MLGGHSWIWWLLVLHVSGLLAFVLLSLGYLLARGADRPSSHEEHDW